METLLAEPLPEGVSLISSATSGEIDTAFFQTAYPAAGDWVSVSARPWIARRPFQAGRTSEGSHSFALWYADWTYLVDYATG